MAWPGSANSGGDDNLGDAEASFAFPAVSFVPKSRLNNRIMAFHLFAGRRQIKLRLTKPLTRNRPAFRVIITHSKIRPPNIFSHPENHLWFQTQLVKNDRLRGITYENAVAFSVWRTRFPFTLARKV
jgi:hypothetical protein